MAPRVDASHRGDTAVDNLHIIYGLGIHYLHFQTTVTRKQNKVNALGAHGFPGPVYSVESRPFYRYFQFESSSNGLVY